MGGSSYFFWGEALHVGALDELGEVDVKVGDVRVYCHLVLPLKLQPHL